MNIAEKRRQENDMKEKTKEKLIVWLCVVALVLFIGGIFGSIIGITQSHDKNAKTPLGWCVWEITTHEDYSDCDYSYTYEIPNPPEGERNEPNVYCYVITMYTDEGVGLWYCFIQCVCNHTLYKSLHLNGGITFQSNEVKLIDCDLGYEILVGKEIVYE